MGKTQDENIENHDWVHHTKFKVVGKVIGKTSLGYPAREAYEVWVADNIPNQVWDALDVRLYQKKGTK